MNREKSPTLEILAMAMAAVTVLVAALMVLKHSFQNEAFASNFPPEATSVADVDPSAIEAPPPPRSWEELMDGFSSVSNRAAADRIYRALEKPCPPLDFPRNTDLRDILEPIFDRLKQNEGESFSILEDAGALDADSIELDDVKIEAFHVEGISIRSALDELLVQTDPQLDYMVRSEVLLITTRTAAESDENLMIRVYDVRSLVAPIQTSIESQGGVRRSSNSSLPSSRELAQWVMDSTAPPARWFDIDGEGGRLNFHNQLLIIRQSRRVHLAISDLLEQLAERIGLSHTE